MAVCRQVYQLDAGKVLWVPAPDMFLVHEASKPNAVLDRAGFHRENWGTWERRYFADYPWLRDWLYNSRMPWPHGTVLSPTEVMLAFRGQATQEAIAEAAKRPPEQVAAKKRADYLPHVSVQEIDRWRNELAELGEWIDGWFLRGDEPPPHVHVPTVEQVRRCAEAWDYIAICEAAGLTYVNTFRRWFSGAIKLIPDQRWLKFLYGLGVAPSFMVALPLQRVRAEGSIPAIAKAAGLGAETACRFLRTPALKEILQEAIAQAGIGGSNRETLPACITSKNIRPDRALNLWAYARAATMAARCRRADLDDSELNRYRREAREWGVEEELLRYLNHEGEYDCKNVPCGLVAAKFFVPSPAWITFQKFASRLATTNKIRELQNMPGFDAWFLDATTIRETKGRRVVLPAELGQANGDRPLPRWDEADRKLWLGSKLLKAFTSWGRNQVDLIEAFAREAWAKSISDPFRDAEKLRQTCKDLNRSLAPGFIRFGAEGTGEGIRWDFVEDL